MTVRLPVNQQIADQQTTDQQAAKPQSAIPVVSDEPASVDAAASRVLSPAAERALAEAAQRRAALDAREKALSAVPERDGRGGLEPVRYGDWEIKGLASDF